MTPPIPPGERLSEADFLREVARGIAGESPEAQEARFRLYRIADSLATPSDSCQNMDDMNDTVLRGLASGELDMPSDSGGEGLVLVPRAELRAEADALDALNKEHPSLRESTVALAARTLRQFAARPATPPTAATPAGISHPSIGDAVAVVAATPTGPLSSRLRPNVECAPWVIAEVQKLEAKLEAAATPTDAGFASMHGAATPSVVPALPGNWPEDTGLENGNYSCTCCHCGANFFGHKRRVTCKLCAATPTVECAECECQYDGSLRACPECGLSDEPDAATPSDDAEPEGDAYLAGIMAREPRDYLGAATPSAGDAERKFDSTPAGLLREIVWGHSSPDSVNYNECDKGECMWCAEAKAAIAALTRPQGAATLAVDDAMVERACNAYPGLLYNAAGNDTRADMRKDMRAALTVLIAALNPSQAGGGK